MWEEPVRDRGGTPVSSLADAAAAELDSSGFAAVLLREHAILPAVAALDPAQAAAYLALADSDPDRGAAANRFCERLRASGRHAYLLKSGRVGGQDPDRSLEVTGDHAAAILDAIVAETVEWERDPDFGYRVAAGLPGIEGRDRFVLIPRFLYARTERVYEYAAIVPRLKRERAERLSALRGLDPAIIETVR